MADGCLLNGVHLMDTFDQTNTFAKMLTSPHLPEQQFAAFSLSGRGMFVSGSSVDQKFGTYTVSYLEIYNVLSSGNGRSAGGVVRVRGSSVRPRRDQPLRCPRASQAQVPCTGEIDKRTI